MVTLSTLEDKGFALQAVLDVDGLPEWIVDPIRHADVDLRHFQRLVMLGQGGRGLWEAIHAEGVDSDDRFDEFARRSVAGFIEGLGNPQYEIMYPSEVLLPLGRMAEYAGWGRASPLGLTINDEFGLWMAHRIVFLVGADLPLYRRTSTHPCDTCVDTPCVTACPVGAVSVDEGFDVGKCSNFRIAPFSACADRCLARLACPIATEHTYGEAQMNYHYAAGLVSIKRWFES